MMLFMFKKCWFWIRRKMRIMRKPKVRAIGNVIRGYNPRDRPSGKDRKFYAIEEQPDGTVNVYLCPAIRTYDTDLGIKEYDIEIRVVRGVIPWFGMEDDIRARFDSWCSSGEIIDL